VDVIMATPSIRPGLYAAVLAVAIVPLYLLDIGSWLIETNDEARFPVMARDILASGHWLLPEIAATPMLNKPPLYAWLVALASLPGGAVTARTAALPSVAASFGIMLATAWLGARLFGAWTGLTAGFVAATTGGLFALAHVPLPDTTVTLAITAAMCAFAVAEFEDRRRALVVFYGATGLAFLVKGPVGLLPIAAALAFEFLTRGSTGPRRLRSLPGVLLLGLLIVPWLVLAVQIGGSTFVDKVLLKDMQDTYVGLSGLRWQRLTRPVMLAVTHLLPWVVLAPFAIWFAVREADRPNARRLLFLMTWASAVLVLVGISEQQRLRYYLPLVPPVSLLVAAWYQRLPVRRGAIILSAVGAVLVVLTLGAGGLYEARARHRRNTIDDVAREIETGPVFAVNSPDIVFHFYLERSVVPLTYYSQFTSIRGPAYLLASEQVARAAPASVERRGTARVAGRTFVLLKKS
jgi:4-amino-4-deoxy-L-arabinose transferase-like glycosyltransferase